MMHSPPMVCQICYIFRNVTMRASLRLEEHEDEPEEEEPPCQMCEQMRAGMSEKTSLNIILGKMLCFPFFNVSSRPFF